jgi:hypothetical protein
MHLIPRLPAPGDGAPTGKGGRLLVSAMPAGTVLVIYDKRPNGQYVKRIVRTTSALMLHVREKFTEPIAVKKRQSAAQEKPTAEDRRAG